jgi:hypothetical protein
MQAVVPLTRLTSFSTRPVQRLMGFSRMRLITTLCSQTRTCTTYTAITQAATLAAPKICFSPTPRDWTLFCIHTLLLRVVSAFTFMGLISFYSLPLQKKYVHGVSECGTCLHSWLYIHSTKRYRVLSLSFYVFAALLCFIPRTIYTSQEPTQIVRWGFLLLVQEAD